MMTPTLVAATLALLGGAHGTATTCSAQDGQCGVAGAKLERDHQFLQVGADKAKVTRVEDQRERRAPGEFDGANCHGMTDVEQACSSNSCRVLATNMQGKTCKEYCARNDGRACHGAWEEVDETCGVKEEWLCDRVYKHTTSDLICECSPMRGSSGPVSSGGRRDASELTLVWSDEFDGNSVDRSKWDLVVGGGGFGNWELQHYSDRSENARVENGILKIDAKCENYHWSQYTSAKLQTLNRASWGPGHRVDVRARAPTGRGTWPAIWMLSKHNVYGGWPRSGEIDIMESVGCTEGKIYGTVHTDAYNHMKHTEKFNTVNTDVGAWHTYSIEWTDTEIRWYIDDNHFHTFHPSSYESDKWPYNQEFYLILNVAVGGSWGGYCLNGRSPSCSSSGEFGNSQVMEVDFARVYAL